MTDQQNTAATPVAATPIDSGPGPLDVLEARITLETRHALDSANRAVEQLVAFLEQSPRPQPSAVARHCRLVAADIDNAVGTAHALARVSGDRL